MWLTDWMGGFFVSLPERAGRAQIQEARVALGDAIAKQAALDEEERKKRAERPVSDARFCRRVPPEIRHSIDSGIRYSIRGLEESESFLPESVFEKGAASRKAISGQITSFAEAGRAKTFSEELVSLVSSKCRGLAPMAYKRAGISRQVYSRIISSRYSRVDKLTAMRLCIGLQLDMDESIAFLKLAGYTFSDSLLMDAIFSHCIKNRIFNVLDVNQIIEDCGQKPFDVVF